MKLSQETQNNVNKLNLIIDSSIYLYLFQIFWNSGCQLVSLNFQTPDLSMQLNQGRFEYNGNCGKIILTQLFVYNFFHFLHPFCRLFTEAGFHAQGRPNIRPFCRNSRRWSDCGSMYGSSDFWAILVRQKSRNIRGSKFFIGNICICNNYVKLLHIFLQVDMYGLPTDTIRKEFRTKIVPANGLNPVYENEIFSFRKVILLQ